MSRTDDEMVRLQERENLIEKAGLALLDALAAPVPADLARRFQLPRCPHCGRRGELRIVKGAGIRVQNREGSSASTEIPGYRILPCCSARYAKTKKGVVRQNPGLSKLQVRRLREQASRAARDRSEDTGREAAKNRNFAKQYGVPGSRVGAPAPRGASREAGGGE